MSLLWNLVNSVLVHRSWRNTNRLTDYRKIREMPDKAIIELRSLKKEVQALQTFGGTDLKFKKLFESLNQRISVSYTQNLAVALEVLDGSLQVEGTDWESEANAKWDDVGDKMNSVYTVPTLQRNDALQRLERSLNALTECVSGRLDRSQIALMNFWKRPKVSHILVGASVLLVVTLVWLHEKSISAFASKETQSDSSQSLSDQR